MQKTLDNFQASLADIHLLLDLAATLNAPDDRVIFRSAVVLLIASWEQYVEQLAVTAIRILTDRLRDSTTLPENVKQNIAFFSVAKKRDNAREFSDSVWAFADKGWKYAYMQYCNKLVSRLHTASPDNVRDLYWNVLGFRDITTAWSFNNLDSDGAIRKLNELVDLRHDIAHGANVKSDGVSAKDVREYADFIASIAKNTFQSVFDYTANLSRTQALEYSLKPACFSAIIEFAAQKPDRVLTLEEIKHLGSSAQGNHNKLRYAPWSLLEFVDNRTRRVSDRLLQFYHGEITLPLEILVFDNGESIPKPDTKRVLFSDLRQT